MRLVVVGIVHVEQGSAGVCVITVGGIAIHALFPSAARPAGQSDIKQSDMLCLTFLGRTPQ
jgi:hypothetical protein